MSVHIAPLMLHARGYVTSVDVSRDLCDMKEPYLYHIVILINDMGVARLEGLDGAISHGDRRELANKLRGYGIEKHTNLIG